MLPLPRFKARRRVGWVVAVAFVALLADLGCQRAPADDAVDVVSPRSVGLPPAGDAVAASRPRVVVLGDSLTAGLGLGPEEAFPARLQERLDAEGLPYEVVNAGESGGTSAGGLRRAEWALDGDVRVLIVALGGNDGLRGLPPGQMKDNLAGIIDLAQSRGVSVLLAGMEAPPNFGDTYTQQFRQVFRDLAEERDVAFVPFLLDGVAGERRFNQADGIHPNPAGARRVADLLWPALRGMLTGETLQ